VVEPTGIRRRAIRAKLLRRWVITACSMLPRGQPATPHCWLLRGAGKAAWPTGTFGTATPAPADPPTVELVRHWRSGLVLRVGAQTGQISAIRCHYRGGPCPPVDVVTVGTEPSSRMVALSDATSEAIQQTWGPFLSRKDPAGQADPPDLEETWMPSARVQGHQRALPVVYPRQHPVRIVRFQPRHLRGQELALRSNPKSKKNRRGASVPTRPENARGPYAAAFERVKRLGAGKNVWFRVCRRGQSCCLSSNPWDPFGRRRVEEVSDPSVSLRDECYPLMNASGNEVGRRFRCPPLPPRSSCGPRCRKLEFSTLSWEALRGSAAELTFRDHRQVGSRTLVSIHPRSRLTVDRPAQTQRQPFVFAATTNGFNIRVVHADKSMAAWRRIKASFLPHTSTSARWFYYGGIKNWSKTASEWPVFVHPFRATGCSSQSTLRLAPVRTSTLLVAGADLRSASR